jgi:tRNA pseudouridine55 synthase
MFGLLNIDKPAGITSRDVVNRVCKLARRHKVGHAGTLDPLATGVLVVALGPATRLIEYMQRMPKAYRGTFLLGRTSDTEDIEGAVVNLAGAPLPTLEQIRSALPPFIGTIQQRPPAYSALKVGGERAHELARRGEAVELAPRSIEVHEIQVVRYDYPELDLLIRCGSGTYVRSLGRDIARSLGTDAVLSILRRQAIGPFRAEDAVPYADLSCEVIHERLLLPVLALGEMPRIDVNYEEYMRLANGQVIPNRWGVTANEVAALDAADHLVAILVLRADGSLQPEKCFIRT